VEFWHQHGAIGSNPDVSIPMAVELPVSGLALAAGRHLVNYLCSLSFSTIWISRKRSLDLAKTIRATHWNFCQLPTHPV
jgi:hypothetical protein